MRAFLKNKQNTIAILLVITVVVFLVVDIASRIIAMNTSPPESDRQTATGAPDREMAKAPLETYGIIITRNLFRTTDRPIAMDPMDANSLEATALQLELYGTVAGEDGRGYAIIEEKDKKRQRVYKVGDNIGGATIVRIMRNAVVLRLGDRDEVLKKKEMAATARAQRELPGMATQQTPEAPPPPRPLSRMPSGGPAGSSADLANLLTQARVTPHVTAGTTGKPDGIVISEIQSGSLFENAGLVNGDVIREVNGKAVTGVSDLVAMYRDLKPGAELSVKVTRMGRQVVLNHRVE